MGLSSIEEDYAANSEVLFIVQASAPTLQLFQIRTLTVGSPPKKEITVQVHYLTLQTL